MGQESWLGWVLFTAGPVVGTMVAACAYRLRERSRWDGLLRVIHTARGGTRVRYRSLDRAGRAVAEWDVTMAKESRDERRL